MRPILLSFGPIQISSLGFFLFLAFLLGTFAIWKKAKEKLYNEERVFDSIFFVTLVGLAGARLSYIFLNWGNFGFDIFKWILINGSSAGLYFWGGFLSGLTALYWYYSREESFSSGRQRIPFWEIFDYFALAFWISFLISEIGVFLDGGEVGKVEVAFRHPVALYKTLILGGFLGGLIKLTSDRHIVLSTGSFALLFLLIFGLTNFLVDFFKSFSVYYWGLGLDQWASEGIVLVSSVLLYRHMGRSVRKDLTLISSKIQRHKVSKHP